MTRDEIESDLKSFIVSELLDGKSAGLDAETPLLEWGVLDSMSMARLLAFIETRWGIEVLPKQVTAHNFRNLGAIATLLLSIAA